MEVNEIVNTLVKIDNSRSEIKSTGMSVGLAVSLESIAPDLISDTHPIESFTQTPSTVNKEMALEALDTLATGFNREAVDSINAAFYVLLGTITGLLMGRRTVKGTGNNFSESEITKIRDDYVELLANPTDITADTAELMALVTQQEQHMVKTYSTELDKLIASNVKGYTLDTNIALVEGLLELSMVLLNTIEDVLEIVSDSYTNLDHPDKIKDTLTKVKALYSQGDLLSIPYSLKPVLQHLKRHRVTLLPHVSSGLDIDVKWTANNPDNYWNMVPITGSGNRPKYIDYSTVNLGLTTEPADTPVDPKYLFNRVGYNHRDYGLKRDFDKLASRAKRVYKGYQSFHNDLPELQAKRLDHWHGLDIFPEQLVWPVGHSLVDNKLGATKLSSSSNLTFKGDTNKFFTAARMPGTIVTNGSLVTNLYLSFDYLNKLLSSTIDIVTRIESLNVNTATLDQLKRNALDSTT